MQRSKSIIIGCYDPIYLPVIIDNVKNLGSDNYRLVTFTHERDLPDLLSKLKPDLLILYFKTNMEILNMIEGELKKENVPVICLKESYSSDEVYCQPDCVCLSFPFELINYKKHLSFTIDSIFKLRDTAPVHEVETLAQSAMRQAQQTSGNNLSRYVMELDQKIETLLMVKTRIAELYPKVEDPIRRELTSIVHSIKLAADNSKIWNDFKLYFEHDNPNFLWRLAEKHPSLTQKDLKYCCYLSMNMSNDDIRNLLGINQESVRTHKYRLKRKLLLSKDQDLRSYLRSLGH